MIIGLVAIISFIAGITAIYFYNFELFSKIVKPHQLHRVQTFLNPSSDPNQSYHALNSIKAVSSGQILIYQLIKIAMNCEDLSRQIFENIAMHTGLMPLTGIALPFISYGGSSLLTNMISIGLVLSIKVHTKKDDFL